MKKMKRIFAVVIIAFLSISCSKHDDEEIVDCFGESILIQLKHSVDGADSKKINYPIEYAGTKTITSVKWTFGDGTTGEGMNVSHTYAAAGTFEVKADVTTKEGSSACTSSPKKSITVN